MAFALVDIPQFRNEWDELEEAILEAKEVAKAILVPCPPDKSPASYRNTIKINMKNRGIAVYTMCSLDSIYVWYKAHLKEEAAQ